ncbi:hypothetical protein [Kribbella sp. NPDC050470]|uniref:hypothetical protein n=1 Tax=unclassified Kribbella TaxID=2644121 RepID=UPI0037AE8C0B
MAAVHPANVYLREDHLTRKVNAWIATLFSPEHLAETAEALAAVEEDHESAFVPVRLAQRIEAAEAAMARLRRALEAGWDPAALTEQYNAAVADKRAAEVPERLGSR